MLLKVSINSYAAVQLTQRRECSYYSPTEFHYVRLDEPRTLRAKTFQIFLTTRTSGASVASAAPCNEHSRCRRERDPFQTSLTRVFMQHKDVFMCHNTPSIP